MRHHRAYRAYFIADVWKNRAEMRLYAAGSGVKIGVETGIHMLHDGDVIKRASFARAGTRFEPSALLGLENAHPDAGRAAGGVIHPYAAEIEVVACWNNINLRRRRVGESRHHGKLAMRSHMYMGARRTAAAFDVRGIVGAVDGGVPELPGREDDDVVQQISVAVRLPQDHLHFIDQVIEQWNDDVVKDLPYALDDRSLELINEGSRKIGQRPRKVRQIHVAGVLQIGLDLPQVDLGGLLRDVATDIAHRLYLIGKIQRRQIDHTDDSRDHVVIAAGHAIAGDRSNRVPGGKDPHAECLRGAGGLAVDQPIDDQPIIVVIAAARFLVDDLDLI